MSKYTDKLYELIKEGAVNEHTLVHDLIHWLGEEKIKEYFEQRVAFDNDYFGEEE